MNKGLKQLICVLAVGFLVCTALLPAIILQPKNVFADVPYENPHFEAITYLKEAGILNANPDGSFRPKSSLTRTEVLEILFTAAKIEIDPFDTDWENRFTDTREGQWYIPYIKKAKELDIISGGSESMGYPQKNVSRAEFLKFLSKTFQLNMDTYNGEANYSDVSGEWYQSFASFSYAKKLFDSDQGGKLYPNKEITKEKLAEALYRFIK